MPARSSIAIASLACRLPDARSPAELWANVIEGRRSFRPIPRERLDLASYAAASIGETDSITPICAGLLTNWSFDRGRFRIAKSTFEATDLTHWLALELAAEAVEAIGGTGRIDRTRTAVIVANTLTGEFSRASLLRLRAPFLDVLVAEAAERTGLAGSESEALRSHFLAQLRNRFPDPNEDSLAGGLANTIAGRIANHFDLHGGAYTVDGACASSLVAVADAASLLAADEVDAVIVGAVDLSLDPFELVGFSRNGALARDEMRVFDARSGGFWPGEGGAFAVLMRADDAQRRELPILARIRGWGISTDGAGGLTRPSIAGQLLAAQRACAAACADPTDLSFVEAHGTGTAVGDPTEVRALAALREGARRPLPVGSIKANIGHTKAVAGFAGLIKAAAALRNGIVPPHVGCSAPHPVFAEVDDRVHPALGPQRITGAAPLAGVSSFGFGGINSHIVLEGPASGARRALLPATPRTHDAELFLFAGEQQDVLQRIAELDHRAGSMSVSELADAAAFCAANVVKGPVKTAIVASHQTELRERLARASALITTGRSVIAANEGIFVGEPTTPPRLGFVFPGQAAPSRPDGGIWQKCFEHSASLTRQQPSHVSDRVATDIAQPAIMAANVAALQLMRRLGVRAEIAVGHSLGEIAALCWAGAMSEEDAVRLARRRGRIMARDAQSGGGMLHVAISAAEARALAARTGVTVACENGALDTVLAGSRPAIDRAAAICASSGIVAMPLTVSHAFHSEEMARAAPALHKALGGVAWKPIAAAIVSTVTGKLVDHGADVREMLTRQLTDSVRFDAAMHQASMRANLFVEVGPGEGLSRLVRERGIPCLHTDAFGASLRPLLTTVAELHVRGCVVDLAPLFAERSIRPLELSAPEFLHSPCASRRMSTGGPVPAAPAQAEVRSPIVESSDDPLDVVLAVLAAATGILASSLDADDRFLDKLHLNSLAVSRIVLAAARSLGCRAPSMPTEFANATPRILADNLKELRDFSDGNAPQPERVGGVRRWVRTYAMRWVAAKPPRARAEPICWSTADDSSEPDFRRTSSELGLLIWLEGNFDPHRAERLVELAAGAARGGTYHLAICHDGAPISGFARSVARERHFRSVRVIDRAGFPSTDLRVVSALGAAVDGYYEVRFGAAGKYEAPIFVPAEAELSELPAVGPGDVAVVVGGAKGIAAECALRIGSRGAALILVGRSSSEDEAVVETLRRAQVAGLRCHYVQADVLDREALSTALMPAFSELGAATVLVHAPAVNEPAALTNISKEALRRTLAPKTTGLECTIAALGSTLRQVVGFGSIIGRIGLEGEAHYALANAMQTAATENWVREMPGRSALTLEWSVWAGTGMGERLGTLDRLAAAGVDPLSLDDALGAFDTLIAGSAAGTVAVTSRFGPSPELGLGASDLPSLRFIDEPKVYYPGVEIVVGTTLSPGRDPYLQDHFVDGRYLLPGVVALEAMAQAAEVLAPFESRRAATGVRFLRAVAFECGSDLRIRIAALSTAAAAVEAVIFAEDDGFREPCARATFSQSNPLPGPLPVSPNERGFDAAPLYDGGLLFQGGRFRKIDRFERATSREVAARLKHAPPASFFGAFEPSRLALWDPAAADAAMHALQVAVPHRRVLPVAVERIEILRGAGEPVRIAAIERSAADGTYVFDLTVENASGRVVQAWIGATFRAVESVDPARSLASTQALIVPYLERVAREGLQDETVRAAFIVDAEASRTERRSAALDFLQIDDLDRRGDGRPVRTRNTGSVSIAHRDGITLMVAANREIGCDLEKIPLARGLVPLELRQHVAAESFRKLGRLSRPPNLPALNGESVLVEDARLLIVELPTPLGPHLIGLGGDTQLAGAGERARRELPQ